MSLGTTRKYPWTPENSTPGGAVNNGGSIYVPGPRDPDPKVSSSSPTGDQSTFRFEPDYNMGNFNPTGADNGPGMNGARKSTQEGLSIDTFTTLIAVACGLVVILVVMILIITIYALMKRKKMNYRPHNQLLVSVPVNVNGHHKPPIAMTNDDGNYGLNESGRPLIEHHDTSEYMFITSRRPMNEDQFRQCNGNGAESPNEYLNFANEQLSSNSNAETPTDSVPGSVGCSGTTYTNINNNNNYRSVSGNVYSTNNKLKLVSQPTTDSIDSGVCPNSKRSQSEENVQPLNKVLITGGGDFSYVTEKPELVEFCDRESMV